MLAVGMGIRCFVPSEPGSKWVALIHLGHILIGAVGPLALISPPRLSSVWFPPKQRTFATAMMVMAQSVGTALAFIIIPYITQHYSIHTMLYVQAELGLFAALLASIYFPPRPDTPPSQSATMERTNFWSSLKALMCNRSFIVLAVSGGLIAGGNRCVMNESTYQLLPIKGYYYRGRWYASLYLHASEHVTHTILEIDPVECIAL